MEEEIIPIAPEEIPIQFQLGKMLFRDGRYQEALKRFGSILKVAPGSIGTRIWIRKTKEALAKPLGVEEAKAQYCVWMSLGMTSYRICTNYYNCMSCEFDQEIRDKMARGQTPELDKAIARLKELSGSQRLCRYAIKGDFSYRLCSRLYGCDTCELGQMMDNALRQIVSQREAEIALRQEALRRKEQSWWWAYWGLEVPKVVAKSHSSN